MPSSWGKKLKKKLNDLADTASKESIQTLSNWIAFNRKHAPTIASVLTNALKDCKNNEKRQWLNWQIIHEILVREKGDALKWDKLGELRLALGEALQPSMKLLGSSMPDQLDSYLEEWEDLDVFGGPSVNAQIRRIFQNRKNMSTAVGNSNETKSSGSAAENERSLLPKEGSLTPSAGSELGSSIFFSDKKKSPVELDKNERSIDNDKSDDAIHPVRNNDDDDSVHRLQSQLSTTNPSEIYDVKSPTEQKRDSSAKQQVVYDFESKGIPSGPVESREFLDPCKAITTLQIARDIRTNTAVEISTALKNLPADILSTGQDLDNGILQELDTAMTNEFSIRIPSSLIDIDMTEETSSLNTFQDIIDRQKKAREKLIYLLLKSRCKFGSSEAAHEFCEIDNLVENLKKRKEALSDALELEGLDTNEIGNNTVTKNTSSQVKKGSCEQKLSPLKWYKPDGSNEV